MKSSFCNEESEAQRGKASKEQNKNYFKARAAKPFTIIPVLFCFLVSCETDNNSDNNGKNGSEKLRKVFNQDYI